MNARGKRLPPKLAVENALKEFLFELIKSVGETRQRGTDRTTEVATVGNADGWPRGRCRGTGLRGHFAAPGWLGTKTGVLPILGQYGDFINITDDIDRTEN